MTTDPIQRGARFAALYEAHYAVVLAYGRRRSSGSVAEDVAHDTFLVAWRRLDDVPLDSLPWLLGVARRVLANDRRSDARRAALLDRLAQIGNISWADDREADRAAISPRLRAALEDLSPAALEALLLTAWEGLTPSSASKVVGCSQTTFRARLYRARRSLARALRDVPGCDSVSPREEPSRGPQKGVLGDAH
jgi:RNA polymerase sigma factor (sigma-70 family)